MFTGSKENDLGYFSPRTYTGDFDVLYMYGKIKINLIELS